MGTEIVSIRRARAGRRAQSKYEDLRGRWRKRVLPRLRWVTFALVGVCFVLGLVFPSKLAFLAGFIGGVTYGFWLYARDAVPHHIEKWLDGANGERWTEKQLCPLERQGWLVEHDLDGRFGNVDHLIVGPAGVFLLDSKNWSGEVRLAPDGVTVTPKDGGPEDSWSPTGLERRMRGMSAGNKEAFQSLTGVRAWVQPVVVVWAPFKDGSFEYGGVAYVPGPEIREWLLSRPRRLDDEKIQKLGALIAG